MRIIEIIRKGSVFFILLFIILLLSFLSEKFLTLDNLLTVSLQTSIIALVAIGMTFTIITGGIDLSVGSVAALCGALAAGIAVRVGLGTYSGILLGILVGGFVGMVNGALVVWGRLPPFVATLAMMAAARGLTLVYTQGRPIAGLDEKFVIWGTGDFSGIPIPVIVMLVVALVAQFILSKTVLGLHTYAVGDNGEETARLAGVAVGKVKLSVYVVSGLCAGLTGVILTARLWSAQPNAGVLLELDAIAASVLGGASLFGGSGTISGSIAGAFIIGVLSNGLNLLEIPSYNQQVVKGMVFILAVLLDIFLKRSWSGLKITASKPAKSQSN